MEQRRFCSKFGPEHHPKRQPGCIPVQGQCDRWVACCVINPLDRVEPPQPAEEFVHVIHVRMQMAKLRRRVGRGGREPYVVVAEEPCELTGNDVLLGAWFCTRNTPRQFSPDHAGEDLILVSPGPLWDTPAPYRSTRNGGPPLEPRSAGRPTIDTPELRDRIFELLGDGMPLRAICRVEGMPARRTVYNWKARDPEFDRQLSFAAQEGCIRLVETISEQFERIVQTHPPKVARRWWNLRLRQLIRVNPRFFGGSSVKKVASGATRHD